MYIQLYAISAALVLTAAAVLGWSIYGPALYQDLLTSYSLCF